MRRRQFIKGVAAASVVFLLPSCACGEAKPKDPHWGKDTCAHCRMAVGDAEFAAQLVGPGFAWRFYDDLGCALADLRQNQDLSKGKLFVHPKGGSGWVEAESARYVSGLQTPMNFGFAARAEGELTLADVRARLETSEPGGRHDDHQ